MLTDKAYRSVSLTRKTVRRIENKLIRCAISHEPIEYGVFLFCSIGYSILTDNCTIEVCKDQITVNEKPVSSLDEMIDIILDVEGTIPGLVTCKECEGKCYTETGKCEECWGTGLVSEDI